MHHHHPIPTHALPQATEVRRDPATRCSESRHAAATQAQRVGREGILSSGGGRRSGGPTRAPLCLSSRGTAPREFDAEACTVRAPHQQEAAISGCS